MNPHIIIHGVHRDVIQGEIVANYEIIFPQEGGDIHQKGSIGIGKKLEIKPEDGVGTDDPLREVERKNVQEHVSPITNEN